MQAQSTRPIKTFALGYPEADYNEAPFAKAVADHLGTDHRELYTKASDTLELVETMSEWFDEPFADISGALSSNHKVIWAMRAYISHS